MTFLANVGYRFKLPASVDVDGSIVLGSTMAKPTLDRRHKRLTTGYPHLEHRLFDPQLYMAGLDATESPTHCAKLASYPWFGVSGLDEYDSGIQTQASWQDDVEKKIVSICPRHPPTDSGHIRDALQQCIEFQHRFGCRAVILPSPLTTNSGTNYSAELFWLDSALEYLHHRKTENAFNLPVFATVALTDVCVRYDDPNANLLLDLILDAISAREVYGVYIVLEQSSEGDGERQCGNTRALASILRLVHGFSQDCGLRVVVNFMGAFGLVCEAAGAESWASGWYKSLYRFRLADRLGGGLAYPSYWSYPATIDVNLESDFDKIVANGSLDLIADRTSASEGLLAAAAGQDRVRSVPAWQYSANRVTAAKEHFMLSAVQAENLHSQYRDAARRDFVEEWLKEATRRANAVAAVLGPGARTQTLHVQAWLNAFLSYRRDHNC